MAHRREFDGGASQEAQDNFRNIAAPLEALIAQRDAQVRAAMAEYEVKGITDEYAAKEQRWRNAADRVLETIGALRESLARNDETAQAALAKAAAAVANI